MKPESKKYNQCACDALSSGSQASMHVCAQQSQHCRYQEVRSGTLAASSCAPHFSGMQHAAQHCLLITVLYAQGTGQRSWRRSLRA